MRKNCDLYDDAVAFASRAGRRHVFVSKRGEEWSVLGYKNNEVTIKQKGKNRKKTLNQRSFNLFANKHEFFAVAIDY